MIMLLTSNKLHFETKNITRDKRQSFLIIKEKIHQEDITIINMYVTNTINHLVVTVIYRTVHPSGVEHTFS